MRIFLLAVVFGVGCTFAQQDASPANEMATPSAGPPASAAASPAPAPSASPAQEQDPDLAYARQFALNVLDILYSGEYEQAAGLMNPDPPLWKGSKEELHKARSGDLNMMAQARAAYGLRLAMECTKAERVKRPRRPSTEEFFEITIKSTYGDKLTATDLLTILKRDGKFYVERFR